MSIDNIENRESAAAIRTALNAVIDVVNGGSTQSIFGFDVDSNTTSGLTLGLKGGIISFDSYNDYNFYDAGTVTLADNTTSGLIICPDLGSSIATACRFGVSQIFLPISQFALYAITTASGNITSISDLRTNNQLGIISQNLVDISFIKMFDNKGTPAVHLKEGWIQTANGPIRVISPSVNLTDNSDNYIEIDSSGNVTCNASAFSADKMPLYHIVLASGALLAIEDYRALWFVPPLGVSGTFTTADSKTITVTNGLITGIA